MGADFWNDRYRGLTFAYGREPNDFVRSEAHRIPRGRVLCLAEGEGRNAVHLAGLGHDVTALDFSTEGLKKTELLARERGVAVRTLQADLATYEPELDAFTGIVTVFAHVPVAVRRRIHGWIPDALRPGGVFLLEAYSPAQLAWNTGGPRDVELLVSLADLRSELPTLEVILGCEVERDIHEGAFHAGRSATVQYLAQRAHLDRLVTPTS
ncbi:MAG: methyltransferase domain-containing protein [Polyangiaceae bacterium]